MTHQNYCHTSPNAMKRSTLVELIEDCKWRCVSQLLETSAGQAQAKSATKSTNFEKSLPLHLACYRGAPFYVVRALLLANPHAACIRDDFGCLPLHGACAKLDDSGKIVNMLMDVYPEGAEVEDHFGCLPLHLALTSGGKCAGKTALELLQRYPQAASMPDMEGSLPIHHLLSSSSSRTISGSSIYPTSSSSSEMLLRELLRVYPDGASTYNADGRLPIHLACLTNRQRRSDFVQIILEAYPQGARKFDCDGFLPIHYILSTTDSAPNHLDEARWWTYHRNSILTLLLDVYPDAARFPGLPSTEGNSDDPSPFTWSRLFLQGASATLTYTRHPPYDMMDMNEAIL